MARASFRLRKSTLDKGSYLQYPLDTEGYASRTDNDNYLRADDLLLVPTDSGFTTEEGTFEAYVVDYNAVEIKWNVQLEQEIGATPVPYQVIIKYNNDGFAQSVNTGETLRETTYSDKLIHKLDDGTLWSYYTLFIRYVSTTSPASVTPPVYNDDYYEPVANVKVLMPTNYGSTDDLFARIPEYYRRLDNQQENGQTRGPLYRFLSIMGWDLDISRTLLDYLITIKDPQIADQEALDILAKDFGIGIQTHELGAQRVRSLIDVIGTIRRGKGTLGIVERTFKSLTGCDVGYDVTTGNITVYAQRANLLYDPRIISGIVGSIDGGIPSSIYAEGYNLDSGQVGSTQFDGDYDGGASVNPDYTGGGTLGLTGGWQTYPDFANPGIEILERATPEIMLKTGDIVYFSAHCEAQVQELVQGVSLYTGSFSEGTTKYVVDHDSTTQVGTTRYWRLEIPQGYEDYTAMNLVIKMADSPVYSVADLDKLLLERNIIDDYFDGDSVLGSWIVDGSGSVSDYNWVGNPAESPSVYTDNYQKMKTVVSQLVSSILPVTELVTSGTVYSTQIPTSNLKYSITYNNIPGV